MNLGRYRFAPPWWGVVLFLIVAGIVSALGVWQIERAHYKEGLVAAQTAARRAGPTLMQPTHAPASGNARTADLTYGRRYFVEGRFDAAHQILLRDQVNGRETGYRVWTPMVLGNGLRVMVDRGWVAKPRGADAGLPDPPAPSGAVRIKGFWRSLPQPALSMGGQRVCDKSAWPRALSYPDAAAVRCQYRAPVVGGLLLLDPADPNGFVRDWDADEDLVGLSPFGHYAYASQWFAMAFVAGVILVVVNLERR